MGKLLLASCCSGDSRVDPNAGNNEGETPLWKAAYGGLLDVIVVWIASGREMDLGKPGVEKSDAIHGATLEEGWMSVDQREQKMKVAALLEKFKENPRKTRSEVRTEIGWFEKPAAKIFALVIFNCDGLLKIKGEDMTGVAKFFRISGELPMELQLVLCLRVVGSMRINITGEAREMAFRDLARMLLLP